MAGITVDGEVISPATTRVKLDLNATPCIEIPTGDELTTHVKQEELASAFTATATTVKSEGSTAKKIKNSRSLRNGMVTGKKMVEYGEMLRPVPIIR